MHVGVTTYLFQKALKMTLKTKICRHKSNLAQLFAFVRGGEPFIDLIGKMCGLSLDLCTGVCYMCVWNLSER